MAEPAFVHQFRTELRSWITHRSRSAPIVGSTPPAEDIMERQLAVLVETYRAITLVLGLPPTPDMLARCGWPGAMIRSVCCETRGTWGAFRTVVAQNHPEISYPTSLREGDVVLDSFAERFVLRALRSLSGVTGIDVHPPLPGNSGQQADFLVKAATGRQTYVEVAMVESSSVGEKDFCRIYRDRLTGKLVTYDELGHRPVVIWADQLAPPRVLATKMDDVLAALGLPGRAPPPPVWFEAEFGEEAA